MFAGRPCGLCWQWMFILGTFCRNWSRTGWPAWPSSPGPVRWGNTGSWLVTSPKYWPLIGQSDEVRAGVVESCLSLQNSDTTGWIKRWSWRWFTRVWTTGSSTSATPTGWSSPRSRTGRCNVGCPRWSVCSSSTSVLRYKIFPEQCCSPHELWIPCLRFTAPHSPGCKIELSTNLREVLQCPDKASRPSPCWKYHSVLKKRW